MSNKLTTIAQISPKETIIWEVPIWVAEGFERAKAFRGKRYSLSEYIKDVKDYFPKVVIKEISRTETFIKLEGQSYNYLEIDEFIYFDELIEPKPLRGLQSKAMMVDDFAPFHEGKAIGLNSKINIKL